jgi:SAM-dependent methyltransferase
MKALHRFVSLRIRRGPFGPVQGPCAPLATLFVVVACCFAAGCTQERGGPQHADELVTLEEVRGTTETDSAQAAYDPSAQDGADAPYVSTPAPVVDSMLALAEVTAADTVYDLGSGDGRIPIRAATAYGARGVGIEIRPDLVREARQHAEEAGVADRATFRHGDLFEADISEATVVTLYLLPAVNVALRPKLFRELRPGTRVVSRDFDMREWTPERTVVVEGTTLYLWRIPDTPPPFVNAEE